MSSGTKLFEAKQLLHEFLDAFEPDSYSGDDACLLYDAFTEMERLAVSGKARSAKRVEESGIHKREGHKRPGSFLALRNRESAGQTTGLIDAAKALEDLPVAAQAFNQGQLSVTHVGEIASATDAHPEKEAELVDAAKDLSLPDFKARCAEVRNQTDSEADAIALYERKRAQRYWRTWIDLDGFGRIEAKLMPDALDVVRNALKPFEKLCFDEARKEGRSESHQAYSADALVAMAAAALGGVEWSTLGDDDSAAADGSTTTSTAGLKPRSGKPKPLIRIRVDLESLVRGHALPGETCEIIDGGGHLPASMVWSMLKDSILELVASKGTEIHSVVSDTRFIQKALEIALEERDRVCCVPDCDVTYPLQRDHWKTDFAKNGKTEIDNLLRVCPYHHGLKTNEGWRWEGGPGHWRFVNPKATSQKATPSGQSSGTDPPGPETKRKTSGATGSKSPPKQNRLL
jgi:hypothetical protein